MGERSKDYFQKEARKAAVAGTAAREIKRKRDEEKHRKQQEEIRTRKEEQQRQEEGFERKIASEKAMTRRFIEKSNLKEDLENLADILGGKSLFGLKKKVRFDWVQYRDHADEPFRSSYKDESSGYMKVSCVYRKKTGKKVLSAGEPDYDGGGGATAARIGYTSLHDEISVELGGYYVKGGVDMDVKNTLFISRRGIFTEKEWLSHGTINVVESSKKEVEEMSRDLLMSATREHMEWISEGKV